MAEIGKMETVIKKEDERPVKDVLCCRACLSTEGKLVDMLEYKLDGEFFRVSGIPVTQWTKKLPHYLCVWCAAIVKRCATFSAKCLHANECLEDWLSKGLLITDTIGTIDRQAHKLVLALSFTGIENIDIEGIDPGNIPVALDPTSTANLNVTRLKLEKNDTQKRNGKNDFYIEIDSLNRNEAKVDVKQNIIREIKTENVDMCEVEYLDENIECNELGMRVKVEKKVTRKRNVKSEVKNKKRKTNTDKNAVGVRGRKKKGLSKGRRHSEDGFMPNNVDFDTLKDACDVDVVILTPEEQLADIEAQKATKAYRNAVYKCPLCVKHYRSEDAYNNHCAKHTEKNGPIECPVCKMHFKKRNKYWDHYDGHRIKYVCRQCGVVSRTRNQAKTHRQFHDGKKFECSHCPRTFSKRSSHLSHVRLAHKTLNVACGMCGETFVNVHQHTVLVHGVAIKKEDMDCKTCEVRFVNTPALDKHKMAAGEEHTKMFPCVQCGDNFDSVDAMKIHDDKEHPKCEDCNVTFLNATFFDTHVKRKHLGVGNHYSRKIKEVNQRARELGLPLPYPAPKPRPGWEPKKHVCDHCGKIFTNATLLVYHLRKLRGEKLKYACPHCPKSFYIRESYEDHLRVHTGEKPFKCDHCSRAFSGKSNLQRHVLGVHLGISKKYACEICGRVFTTPSTVKLHVRTVHNGEPWPKRERKRKTTLFSVSSD